MPSNCLSATCVSRLCGQADKTETVADHDRDRGVISIINTMDVFHKTFPQSESAFGKGFMTGMLEFGAMLGCFFMPTLCDKVSRKMALTIVVVIFNIGAIMQTAAKTYGVLVAGRTIAGIGVGTLAMVRRT